MVKEIESSKLLFEGDEDLFYEFTIEHPLIHLSLDYTSFKSFSKLLNESSLEVYRKITNSISGFKESENFKGFFMGALDLNLYYSLINQPDGRFVVVIERGERNKGRFVIYLEGIWQIVE